MPSDRLTELGIRKSTCGPKQKKITDGKGLYLLVHPNGSKYFVWGYRFPPGRGCQQMWHHIGAYGRGSGQWPSRQHGMKRTVWI